MNKQPLLIRLEDEQEFELEATTTIGRREDCNIILDEAGISRLHAQINFTDNKLTIEDFSRNGTLVNGSPIKGVAGLQHKDIVCFDYDQYKIHFPGTSFSDNENQLREPALTEISDDVRRRPLPDRPLDEGTKVVFAQSGGGYEPLNYRDFRSPALVIRNGRLAGKVFSLPDDIQRWTLGSSRDSDILIEDEGVSSTHAVIQRSSNRWEVTDQMSTNVLRVNDTVTNKCYLTRGDKINLGSVDCEFVLPDGYRVRQNTSRSGLLKFFIWGLSLLVLAVAIILAVYLFRDHA